MSEKNAMNEFCCQYALIGDPEEAAVRAGFDRKNALYEAVGFLRSEECQKTITAFRSALADSECIRSGLKRLAFGSCKDAVFLAFAEEMPSAAVIEDLDLFGISEIKRVKGGGVEIKFFDRMKAMEKLYELENAFSEHDKAAELIKALTSSVGEADILDNN